MRRWARFSPPPHRRVPRRPPQSEGPPSAPSEGMFSYRQTRNPLFSFRQSLLNRNLFRNEDSQSIRVSITELLIRLAVQSVIKAELTQAIAVTSHVYLFIYSLYKEQCITNTEENLKQKFAQLTGPIEALTLGLNIIIIASSIVFFIRIRYIDLLYLRKNILLFFKKYHQENENYYVAIRYKNNSKSGWKQHFIKCNHHLKLFFQSSIFSFAFFWFCFICMFHL